jgi:hypothetical protein
MVGARITLLGQDELRYGQRTLVDAGSVAAALSVGADPEAPSLRAKGDPDCPNEDALCALVEDERVLLVVADSHFGVQASHQLVQVLGRASMPTSRGELWTLLDVAVGSPPAAFDQSATALLVAVLDRRRGHVVGLSLGDCTLAWVGPEGSGEALNARTHDYVCPGDELVSLRVRARMIDATVPPDGLLLAFTDGVDECHYRQPASSIRPAHLQALFERTGPAPARYAAELVQMALDGVEGQPGGQDNVALVVART